MGKYVVFQGGTLVLRDVGVYYSSEKKVLPLTVTTYHSAGDLMADYGNAFKLIIFDEVHHLPAPSWGEAALMAPAPFRLGLTATYEQGHQFSPGESSKQWVKSHQNLYNGIGKGHMLSPQ